jgi:hypothetical protein
MGFNPFGAGLGFSTGIWRCAAEFNRVSIPLEQGGVFRQYEVIKSLLRRSFNPFEAGRGLLVHDHNFPLLLLMPQ